MRFDAGTKLQGPNKILRSSSVQKGSTSKLGVTVLVVFVQILQLQVQRGIIHDLFQSHNLGGEK